MLGVSPESGDVLAIQTFQASFPLLTVGRGVEKKVMSARHQSTVAHLVDASGLPVQQPAGGHHVFRGLLSRPEDENALLGSQT
jgi:hypothetical protein